MIQTSLAMPDEFRKTALALPDQMEAWIAEIETPEAVGAMLDKAEMLSQYARRISADTESINAIVYAKLLCVSKLGQLLPASPGKRSDDGTLHNGCARFHRNTLTTYRKIGTRYATEIPEYWKAANDGEDGPEEMSTTGFLRFVGDKGNLKAHQNRGVIEWYTPAEWVERAREVMGSIDLDPATSELANEVVQAARYYTQEDDGLEQPWAGNVFLNPPFAASLISPFVKRLCEEHESGAVPQAVLLMNNNTDTQWWHAAFNASTATCFTEGRVAFYNPEEQTAAPTNGHTFFYFGKRLKKFKEVFGPFGIVATAVK